MKYVYKCQTCEQEREIEHSVEECDTSMIYCNGLNDLLEGELHAAARMHRVIQPSMIVWKGGKPSSL